MITLVGRSAGITLPNPKLGDRERLDLRVVYRRMMDGSVVSYIKGPVIKTFELEFENLNRPKMIEVIKFLNVVAGQSVIYKDYNNQSWSGRIVNYPFETTHVAPRNNTFQIIFEGRSVA